MISKVIFIGDPCRGEQAINIEKTRELFISLLRQFGLTIETCITEINKNSIREEWVPIWKESLSAYPVPVVSSLDLEDAAVIGFEAPEAELRYLSEHGVRWINICIHPLRFLDDLHLEVTTSFAYEKNLIATSLDVVNFCANQIAQRHAHKSVLAGGETLLICGQDWIDRSIYFDGDFRHLDGYIPELDTLVGTHKRVLYKPHPAFSSPEISELIIDRYGAGFCTNASIYEIFFTESVSTVCAISSSVLTEAPYFGVRPVFLEPRAKRYGPAIGYRQLVDDAAFWELGLLGRKEVSAPLRFSSVVPANYLRKTFGSWSCETDEMRISQAEVKAQQAEAKAQQAEAKAQQAEMQVQALLSSASWRVTQPLRWLFGGWKQLVKRGLRWLYQKLGRSPRLLALVKRHLTHFPKVERLVLRAISAATFTPVNQDEDSLSDLELKVLMDLRDAIAVSREGFHEDRH